VDSDVVIIFIFASHWLQPQLPAAETDLEGMSGHATILFWIIAKVELD
jgi:hypothetical protein